MITFTTMKYSISFYGLDVQMFIDSFELEAFLITNANGTYITLE